jgi:hypothetical protein
MFSVILYNLRLLTIALPSYSFHLFSPLTVTFPKLSVILRPLYLLFRLWYYSCSVGRRPLLGASALEYPRHKWQAIVWPVLLRKRNCMGIPTSHCQPYLVATAVCSCVGCGIYQHCPAFVGFMLPSGQQSDISNYAAMPTSIQIIWTVRINSEINWYSFVF